MWNKGKWKIKKREENPCLVSRFEKKEWGREERKKKKQNGSEEMNEKTKEKGNEKRRRGKIIKQ